MDTGRSSYGRRSGCGRGRGRGRGRSGGGNYQDQQGRGGGRGRGRVRGGNHSGFTNQNQWATRPSSQGNSGGGGGGFQQGRSNDPEPHKSTPQQQGAGPSCGRGEVWSGRPWGPKPPSPSVTFVQPHQAPDNLDIQLLKISEEPASPKEYFGVQDQYPANLCLEINAKLGGSSTVDLIERLPNFKGEDHVMFIGAHVNHPRPGNSSCPSIVAVVGTVNSPAANRYASRVCLQEHHKEKIINFGTICLDLVKTYAQFNHVRPNKIVIFHDGVISDGKFGTVLDDELHDLKEAFDGDDYKPKVTVIIAQKCHHFLENEQDGGASGNVPPGSVVDTKIVHPCECHGGIGTSMPTHYYYYVLQDENSFTYDGIQNLIHHMCFTSARCTKPVSLVSPVYYAEMVAYRGHRFQEVMMESQPNASFDQSFYIYNLQHGLQNVMVLV